MTKPADTNGNLLLMPVTPAWVAVRVPLACQAGAAGGVADRQFERESIANREGAGLQKSVELDRFLAGVEQRAFRIALYGVRNPDDALDIVQDAMLQLVRRYSSKPAQEWTPLFYRILHNRIRDFQRHSSVRARVLAFLPGTRRSPEDAPGGDVSQEAPDGKNPGPQRQMALDGSMAALESAIAALPLRQREAFLLRTLEGLDVRSTASAMQCSEGSVKTHYFRAVASLRAALGEHWPTEELGS